MRKRYVHKRIGTVLACTMIVQICGQMTVVPAAEEVSGTETEQSPVIEEVREEEISGTDDADKTEEIGDEFTLEEVGDWVVLTEGEAAETEAGMFQIYYDDQEETEQSGSVFIENIADDQETDSLSWETENIAEWSEENQLPLSLSVSDSEGMVFQPVWMELPDTLTCQGTELPADYGDGICLVTVPEGTEELKLGISYLSGIREEEKSDFVFFARWDGYLTENDGRWQLYPYFPENDTAVYGAPWLQAGQLKVCEADYQDGIYTLPLDPFRLRPEEFTLEQQAVYGILDEKRDYAEICIGSFDEQGKRREHVILLVQFESALDTIEESESESESDSEKEIEIESEAEKFWEYDGGETDDAVQIEPESEDRDREHVDGIMYDATEFELEWDEEQQSEEEKVYDAEVLIMEESLVHETEISVQAFEWEEEMLDTSVAALADAAEISQVYDAAGEQLAETAKEYIPQVSSMNGEWQILGLARSGISIDSSVYTGYKANVVSKLEETNGVLHEKKYTEYSRVILALTALGEDVTDVGGYNLLEPLADFDQTVWQGINGAVFALIAFDCHDYEIPEVSAGKTQNSREKLITYILEQEIPEGGWSMSGGEADADMTAMAVQALAPYCQENSDVKAAVDRALEVLSSMQTEGGGFASYGRETSESCSQVIVALTAAGIDPEKDSRFIKNGNSVMDALLSYQVSEGGFRHVAGQEVNQMATEQAYYALTAYQRFLDGENALYDMSDVPIKSDREKAAETQKMIEKIPDQVTLQDREAVRLALASYNGLNSVQKSLLDPEMAEKLQNSSKELENLEVKYVEQLISAIGTVTVEKENKIVEANKEYHLLGSDQQKQVSNYDVLQKALETLEKLKQAQNQTEKPGQTDQTEKPGQTNQTEKPGQTSQTEKPGQTNQTEKPGQTNQTEKPGQTNQTEKPGQTNQTEKPSQTGTGGSSVKKPTGSTKVVNLVTSHSGDMTESGTTANVTRGTTGTSGNQTAGTSFSYRTVGGTVSGSASDSESESDETENTSGEGNPDMDETEVPAAEKNNPAVRQEITEASRSVVRMMAKLRLSEQAEDFAQEEIDAFIEIYHAYESLTPGEKKYVEDSSAYADYQNTLERQRERNHYDSVTGIDLRENTEENLPWYICLAADPQLLTADQEEAILQVLGEKSQIFGINEIHFVSLLDGSDWKPDHLLKVHLPMADLGEYENAVIVHIRDNGSLEFLEGEITGDHMEFESSDFSEYGIAGIMGSVEDLMQKEEKVPFLPWAAGGGAAILLLLLVLIGKRTIRKEGQK